jgi:multidrug efflux pump
MGEIASGPAGRRERGGLPRPVDQRLHQQLQRRHRLRHPRRPSPSADARVVGRAIAGALNQQYGAHPGRLHRCLPAAAGDGPGHAWAASSCRSRTAAASATPRSTAAKAFMAAAGKAPELGPMFSSYQINVPQLDADLDRTKAKQHGRFGDRRLRHHADLPRLALRERLQPLRPHLPGSRPGRRAVPRQAGRHRQLKTRNNKGEMVPLSSCSRCARPSARNGVRYNGFTRRRHQWRPGPASLRRRPGGDAEDRSPKPCRAASSFEWTDLTYQKILAGNAGLGLPAQRAAGVPGAGRAVRELTCRWRSS